MKKTIVLLALVSIFILPVLCGCKTSKKVGKLPTSSDVFAFIEFYQTNEGETLEGTPIQGPHIHGPNYTFNNDTGELFALNSSISKDALRILLGKGLILKGSKGGGIHTELISYTELPIVDGKLKITSLSNQEIEFLWEDSPVLLRVGEKWMNSFSAVDTVQIPQGEWIVKNTTTYMLVYHGMLQKKNLTIE